MLILLVDAFCGTEELQAVGGAVVPDFGGYRGKKMWVEDHLNWPDAQVGDKLRVVRYQEEFYDYNGFPPFEEGGWDASQKGLSVENPVVERTIIALSSDGVVLDAPLEEGDIVYWVSAEQEGMNSVGWAGHAGFAFARVLLGESGTKMVPHFMAVDIASDNRLLPQESWTSSHIFASTCDEPVVKTRLLYREQPLWLSREKGWDAVDKIMVEQ